MAKDKKHVPKDNSKIVYPQKFDEHMIDVKFKHHLPNLDENFDFRGKKFWTRVWRWITYTFLLPIAYLLVYFFVGLKIVGRKNIKKHKKLLKQGVVAICNHVHFWDVICCLKAVRPLKVYIPTWAVNFTGPNASLIRGAGGMPVPAASVKGMKKLYDTMGELVDENKTVLVLPEASMWWYYDAIRPFKQGAFTVAVRHNKPILPVAISYREAKGFRKIFRRGSPHFLTVNVGEPIFPNTDLQGKEAVIDLLNRSRVAMQELAGFERILPQDAETNPQWSDSNETNK